MLIGRRRGFSLIELMFGLALFAIVLTLAMPTFSTMLKNSRLRGTAESILAGLQAARVEALKLNPAPGQAIEFLLMAEDPDPGDVASFTPNAAGPMWAVRLDQGGGAFMFIEGRAGLEGAGAADAADIYAKVVASNLPVGDTIRFDGLGRSNAVASTRFDVQPADPAQCKHNGGDIRCLRVVVTPGGRVRMCDPSIDPVASPTDTRACEP
jgi:type IV fimbrial biogenesis protein FimT